MLFVEHVDWRRCYSWERDLRGKHFVAVTICSMDAYPQECKIVVHYFEVEISFEIGIVA
jgi:hypothetical protein